MEGLKLRVATIPGPFEGYGKAGDAARCGLGLRVRPPDIPMGLFDRSFGVRLEVGIDLTLLPL